MCGLASAKWLSPAYDVSQLLPHSASRELLLVAPSRISNETPTEPVTHFNELPQGSTKNPASVVLDNFSNYAGLYMQAYHALLDADEDIAPGIPHVAAEVSQAIASATGNFQAGLQALNSSPDSWTGETAEAALQNVDSSFRIPMTISAGVSALGVLAQAFSSTVATTKNDIVSKYANYTADIAHYPEHTDTIEQQYSNFAYAVMTQAYQPNILSIAENNPGFNTAPPPRVNGGLGGPAGGSGFTGGPGAPAFSGGSGGLGPVGGAGGGLGPAGSGGGGIEPVGGSHPAPKFPGPSSVSTPQTPTVSQTSTPAHTPPNPSAAATSPATGLADPNSLGYGLQGLASPLQSALGQAMSAGQRAGNTGAPGGAKGLGRMPPEGVLGLGPKGLKSGAAAMGGGAGVQGPAIGKAAGAPGAAVGPTAGRTEAAGYRAGLSSTPGSLAAGAPAAGAPGAGPHGGAAQGNQHQPSKVLRRKKNGEELIGDTQAVVPVIGEPARTDAAQPNAT
jgi:hypothetical protein